MGKAYKRMQSLQYERKAAPRRSSSKLQMKAASVSGGRAFSRGKQPPPSMTAVANVMDVTSFLSKYLSGKQNVTVSAFSSPTAGFSTGPTTVAGKLFHRINVPSWNSYDLPVGGFDKYRIYREGVWHETCHIKNTPEDLYKWSTDIERDVANIIEDRRIEDIGVEEWPGYLPERIYMQAYASALRPDVSTQYNKNMPPDAIVNQYARREAFLQRLLIGKTRGELQKAEQERVEEIAKNVEDGLAKLKGENPQVVTRGIQNMVREAVAKLGLIDRPKPPSQWEDSYTEEYAKQQGKQQASRKVKADIEKFIKEKGDQAKKEKREDGDNTPATEATKQDVDRARSGSEQVQAEWEKIQKKQAVDTDLIGWNPTSSVSPPELFRDQRFITSMNIQLKDWKTGYKTVVGESGARLSIPDYIRHQDTPFATQLKQSVKGRKMLVLADFSGSMRPKEEDYKRALVSSMEILGSIGSNIALFGFGGDPAVGDVFFNVKRFEEPKWTQSHSAKLSAIEATFDSTPTAAAYQALEKYVQRHRPDVMITVTDGQPDRPDQTKEMVSRLKRSTRMVAFGIGDRQRMEPSLRFFGYNQSFVVEDIHEIPPKLVKTITG